MFFVKKISINYIAYTCKIKMIFFFILTIIYFIIRYYTKNSPTTQKVFTALYAVSILVSQYIIQLNITKELCGEPKIGSALYVSFIPWVFIFGTMMLILTMFPSWLSPFSNTFGYLGAKIAGVNKVLENIFKSTADKEASLSSGNKIALDALEKIYDDPSLLVNEITQKNFNGFWNTMSKSGLFKPNAFNFKESLRNIIYLKDTISETIWYILTGILTISISNNYIVNVGCEKSVNEMKKRHDDYEEKEKKLLQQKKNGSGLPEERVYSSNE